VIPQVLGPLLKRVIWLRLVRELIIKPAGVRCYELWVGRSGVC